MGEWMYKFAYSWSGDQLVSEGLHAPSQYPLSRRLVGPHNRSNRRREEKTLPLPRLELGTLDFPARTHSLYRLIGILLQKVLHMNLFQIQSKPLKKFSRKQPPSLWRSIWWASVFRRKMSIFTSHQSTLMHSRIPNMNKFRSPVQGPASDIYMHKWICIQHSRNKGVNPSESKDRIFHCHSAFSYILHTWESKTLERAPGL
jgi:hypothetical protein